MLLVRNDSDDFLNVWVELETRMTAVQPGETKDVNLFSTSRGKTCHIAITSGTNTDSKFWEGTVPMNSSIPSIITREGVHYKGQLIPNTFNSSKKSRSIYIIVVLVIMVMIYFYFRK